MQTLQIVIASPPEADKLCEAISVGDPLVKIATPKGPRRGGLKWPRNDTTQKLQVQNLSEGGSAHPVSNKVSCSEVAKFKSALVALFPTPLCSFVLQPRRGPFGAGSVVCFW